MTKLLLSRLPCYWGGDRADIVKGGQRQVLDGTVKVWWSREGP